MTAFRTHIVFLAATFAFRTVIASNVTSGEAYASIYWDCCKPSCSWPQKAQLATNPVLTCDVHENPLTDFNAGSGCGTGGTAYACNTQQPWAVNDTFSYGFSSGFIVGGQESDWCCSCYELNFLNGPVAGKTMVVQASNTGYDDPDHNRFGIGAPGGYDYAGACASQYGGTFGVLGSDNPGVTSRDQCNGLPEALRPGCLWRFDWFKNATFPNMTFQRIACPEVLTNKTGCIRGDEAKFANSSSSSSTPSAAGLSMTYLGHTSFSYILPSFLFIVAAFI